MVAEYIYFIVSLPYLSLDRDASISYGEFKKLAKEQLSVKDYQTLSKATFDHAGDKDSNHIIRDWDNFNYCLNEYLTQERAKKLGRTGDEYRARCAYNERIEHRASEIVSLSDPLEAEKAILGEYFIFLSKHEVESQFSLDALIIYGLLLQIKERVASFSPEKGRDEFERLYQSIRKDISLRSNL